MKGKMKKLKIAVILSLMLAVAVVGVALAAQFVLDSFGNTTMSAPLEADENNTKVSLADGDSLSGVIGGERDLELEYTAGDTNDTVKLDVDTANNKLSFSADEGADGKFTVTWDGNDNSTAVNAYNLNTDLTGGVGNDVFYLGVVSDGQFTLRLTVSNDSSTHGVYTINETDLLTGIGRVYRIPFADFSGSVNFGVDVDSVVLEVDPSSDVDFAVSFIETRDDDETLIDFGDLPSSYELTILDDNGAGHWNPGTTIELKQSSDDSVDKEADGSEDANAKGDDDGGVGDTEENGVIPIGYWNNGSGQVDVYVSSGKGCISGWLDWNNGAAVGPDGDFNDDKELIIVNQPVDSANNPNQFSFNDMSFNLSSQTVYARFRIVPDLDNDGICSDQGGLQLTSLVNDGEVEDYEWSFKPTAVTLSSLEARSPWLTSPYTLFAAVALLVVMVGGLVVVQRRKA